MERFRISVCNWIVILNVCFASARIIFLQQPIDVSVYEGESATFSCLFTGSDEVPFWFIDGSYHSWRDLPPQYTISPWDFSLTTENVNIAMNRTPHRCVVEGVESETAFLYVFTNVTETDLDIHVRLITSTQEYSGYYNYASATRVEKSHKGLSVSPTPTNPSTGLPHISQKNIIAITVTTTTSVAVTIFIVVIFVGIGIRKIYKKEQDAATMSDVNIELDANNAYGIVRKRLERFNMTDNIIYDSHVNKRLKSPVHNISSF